MTGTCRPRLAVHKFSSCDGCQLVLLNLGEQLLELARRVDIVHFAEAGPVDEEARADIGLVEGSISTPGDRDRIRRIRDRTGFLITIGACATAGGPQALRNFARSERWLADVYAAPEPIRALATSTPVCDHVEVDLQLWGCPVNRRQVMSALADILAGTVPRVDPEAVCMECKRTQTVCTLVAAGAPCMGPATLAGCGALCPRYGRACYACYGPSERVNGLSLGGRLRDLGLTPEQVVQRFRFLNAEAPAFKASVDALRAGDGTGH